MTLATTIYVHDAIDPHEVFRFCMSDLLKAAPTVKTQDKDGTIMSLPGSGLNAWLAVHYNQTGKPFRTEEQANDHTYCEEELAQTDLDDCSIYHEPPAYLEVNFDTAYGYRDSQGGCTQLHARYIRDLGKWLDGRGIRWSWQDEYSGKVYESFNGLAEFHGRWNDEKATQHFAYSLVSYLTEQQQEIAVNLMYNGWEGSWDDLLLATVKLEA